MAKVFLVSSAVALFVAVAGGMAVALVRGFGGGGRHAPLNPVKTRLALLAEEALKKNNTFTLGAFEVELTPAKQDGTPFLAEFELVAQCLTQEACDFLERHPDLVRSEINAVLLPMPREEALGREGKDKIKKTIVQRLNAIIPIGHLEGVYFTQFRVE